MPLSPRDGGGLAPSGLPPPPPSVPRETPLIRELAREGEDRAPPEREEYRDGERDFGLRIAVAVNIGPPKSAAGEEEVGEMWPSARARRAAARSRSTRACIAA